MATSYILESLTSGRGYLKLKFKVTLQVSSIDTADFTVLNDDATPQEIPLKDVIVRDHFDSIRRELILYYDELPKDTGTYTLKIKNLNTSTGTALPSETIEYEYDYYNDPVNDAVEQEPVVIEDHSIKKDFTLSGGQLSTKHLEIEATEPNDGDLFVDSDFMSGTIAVTFSTRPSVESINSKTVKVQRKKIGGSNFKWENIDIITALHADQPILYIYMPSLDATPVYYSSTTNYFEAGYKYRVILSKYVNSISL